MPNPSNISKETLFNDLPEEIKKQIIELRNASQGKFTFPMSHPLKASSNAAIPNCNKMQEMFVEIVRMTNELSDNTSIEKNFLLETKEFSRFRDLYRNNINNKDVLNEFNKTVAMLETKYTEISRRLKKKTI